VVSENPCQLNRLILFHASLVLIYESEVK